MKKIYVILLLSVLVTAGILSAVPSWGQDTLLTTYVSPVRIVWQKDSSYISRPDLLLRPGIGQSLLGDGVPYCVMTSQGDARPAILLDFGRELHGGIQIVTGMSDGRPVRLRIRYGESVSEAMSEVWGEGGATNDHAIRDFTLEVPVLGTVETGNSGFRFVRIDMLDGDRTLSLKEIRAISIMCDAPWRGSFRSSDSRLDSIWNTGARTVHLCMQNYLWDGIKRDRLVWMGDSYPEIMTIGAVFGYNPVVPRSLDLMRDTTPLPGWMNGGFSSYSIWWLLCHYEWYMFTGDLDYLRESREYITSLLEQLMDRIGNDGRECLDGTRFLDWPSEENEASKAAGLQALMVWGMKTGVEFAEIFGDTDLASRCRKAVEILSDAAPGIYREFETSCPQADVPGSKQAAALMSLAGLDDPERIDSERLSYNGAAGFSTFYGYFMLEAMAQAGNYAGAMEIIRDYWGAMLDLGATSFWEDFDMDWLPAARIDELVPDGIRDIHKDCGAYCYRGFRHSLCHGWASGPTAWLSRHVLGVEIVEPGCRTVRIDPHLGSLDWVEGTFPTPFGEIALRHERRPDGSVRTTYTAPEEVTVLLPAKDSTQRYRAAEHLHGGRIGIERVAGKSFPLVFQSYASVPKQSADDTTWIQVDLGFTQKIEAVKLYPVVRDGWDVYWRSNFPLRFRIEADDDPDFRHPRLITDHMHADLVESDVLEKVETFVPPVHVEGRYVRLTVTKLNTSDNKNYLFELWRMEVMSDGKNIAEGRTLTDSDRGYMGKAPLLRPQRPMGEGVVIDCPENVSSPETWHPVTAGLAVPRNKVRLGKGLFDSAMERNRRYLMDNFSVDDLLKDFRIRAGKPAPGDMMGLAEPWVTVLPGSNAGRFLMGAGNYLRWKDNVALRAKMDAVVEGIYDCEDDGYIMGYPEDRIFYFENGAYCRAWVTHGLIEAGIAGNDKAFPMLRRYYDWFNASPYLPELSRRGGQGRQGVIASTRMYFTPVGKPEDLHVVQRHYQENFWMNQLAARDVDAVWRYPYDRPHSYLIVSLEAFADLYMATGEQRYLDAILGGWDLFKDYYQHIGGAISICELRDYPPESCLVNNGTGELCGNVFWIYFNQRMHLMFPDEEKYTAEIEKSIYNVVLADQEPDGRIRYHTNLAGHKEQGSAHNSCCEGQGTRVLSALPEFIYTKASDGIYVNLFYPSSVRWEHQGQVAGMEMETSFPYGNDVTLRMSLRGKAKSSIRIRVPSWADSEMEIAVNGETVAKGVPGSYVCINRIWENGDEITFRLPATLRVEQYSGISEPYNIRSNHTHALLYGPLLMAIRGNSFRNGTVRLPFSASDLVSRLVRQPDSLIFKIDGVEDDTLEYVPYYEIDDEEMNCLVFFDGD